MPQKDRRKNLTESINMTTDNTTITEEAILENLRDFREAGFSLEDSIFLIAENIANAHGSDDIEEIGQIAEDLASYLKEELNLKSSVEKLADNIVVLENSKSHLSVDQTLNTNADDAIIARKLSLMREGNYPWGKVGQIPAKAVITRLNGLDEDFRNFAIEEIWDNQEAFGSFASGGIESLLEGMEKNK